MGWGIGVKYIGQGVGVKCERLARVVWRRRSDSAESQEPYPLPCLNLITLITYQFALSLFVCLACPWPAYHLRTLADTF
jgi:hypothetical protein